MVEHGGYHFVVVKVMRPSRPFYEIDFDLRGRFTPNLDIRCFDCR